MFVYYYSLFLACWCMMIYLGTLFLYTIWIRRILIKITLGDKLGNSITVITPAIEKRNVLFDKARNLWSTLHNVRFCQFSLSLNLGRTFISKHMTFLIKMPSFRCYCIKKIRKILLANDFSWIWNFKDVWLTPKWWRKPLFFPKLFFPHFYFFC